MTPGVGVCGTCGGGLATTRVGDAWCPRCALASASAEEPAGGGLFALPGYEVRAAIGQGASGIVYRARQQAPAREVAIKILRPHEAASAEARARFRLEAGHVAALDHPAILPLFDVGEHDGLPFFTMKYCAGGTLAERSEKFRGDPRAAARLVATLADAVQHAHARGVLHRDLKPGNVFFDESDRAFVGDFGLAKQAAADEGLTRPNLVYGTPGYLAPEVLAGGARAATVAADVYGLGAILHELVTGAPPSDPGILNTPERWPRDLAAVCARAIAATPAERYPSAAELAEDLRAWCDGRTVKARLPSPGERAWRWVRRNPVVAALAAGLLITLATGGGLLWRKNTELEGALAASFLEQAERVRASDWAGRRAAALAAAQRAARLRPSVAAQSSVAAAAALSDLVRTAEMPRLAGRLWIAGDGTMQRFVHVDYLRGGDLRAHDATGREIARYGDAPGMLSVATEFSPDGRWLAASFLSHSNHCSALVWSADGGAPVWRSGEGFVALSFAADSRWLVVEADGAVRRVGADGASERVATLDFAPEKISCAPRGTDVAVLSRERLAVIEGSSGRVRWARTADFALSAPAWSPEGNLLAVIRPDEANSIEILAAETGARGQTLTEPGRGVRRVEFLADGRLAALAKDDVLTVWSLTRGRVELRQRLAEPNLAFAADRRSFLCTLEPGKATVLAWSPSAVWRDFAGAQDGARASAGELATLTTSVDGKWIAAMDDVGVTLWAVAERRLAGRAPRPENYAPALAFNSTSDALIYSDLARGVFRRGIRVGAGAEASGVFGPEETLVAAPGWRVLENSARDDRLLVYDMKVRVREIAERGPWTPTPWFDTKMTGAEKRGFLDDPGERVFVVNQQSGHGLLRFRSGAPEVDLGTVAADCIGRFSPEGRALWLLDGGALRRIDAVTWRETGRWPVEIRNLPRPWLSFSPDGRTLALGVGDGAVELRETASGAVRLRLTPPHALRSYQVAWSPDGRRLWVCGDGPELHEWDLADIGPGAWR